MDAGPGISFFALNKERLLFATIGAIAVPETVRDEIRQKARQEQRFAAASRVIDKLQARLFEVLSDGVTPELAAAINRMTRMPMVQRKNHPKDLGETMVIAHAVIAAEAGDNVSAYPRSSW